MVLPSPWRMLDSFQYIRQRERNRNAGAELMRIRRRLERETRQAMVNNNTTPLMRDQMRGRTPMKCPICGGALTQVQIRDLGGVTASITWQLHAGHCEEHGWFQAELVSKPPREIFPVNRPFGSARRVVIDGEEFFAFETVWNRLSTEEMREPVDPFDAKWWQPRRLAAS